MLTSAGIVLLVFAGIYFYGIGEALYRGKVDDERIDLVKRKDMTNLSL